MTDTQVLQAQLPLTVCYQPPALQPPYSSSNKDLEDFVGKSFTAQMPLLTSAFGLRRRRWSSPQQCYQHCLRTVTNCMLTQCYPNGTVATQAGYATLSPLRIAVPGILNPGDFGTEK